MSLALHTSLVIGGGAGLVDGLLSVSRNVYATNFALVCLAAPIVPTILLSCSAALVAVVLGRWLGWSPRGVAINLARALLTSFCAAWGVLWWSAVLERARQAGGGSPLLLIGFVVVLGLALAASASANWLLRGIDESAAAARWRWTARVVAGIALLSLLPLAATMSREGRQFLLDTSCGRTRGPDELNILLISIDTLRADRLAAYGGAPELTPSLNRLADDGVVFTTAVSQAPWTLPSVASMLTGLTPSEHGAGLSDNPFDPLARRPLPDDTWTLPQALQQHGYLTQAVVTNPYLSMHYGFGAGFDGYENITMESEGFVALRDSLAIRLLTVLLPQLVVGDIGATVSARAEAWLDRHREEKFFLWLHYLDIHAPYGDPERLGNKSFRSELLAPARLQSLVANDPQGPLGDAFVPIARLRAGEIHLNPSQRHELIQLYDAGVRYDDAQVGRVLRHLQGLGLDERTIVVVLSDHGEEFWEHGGVEHGHSLYEELVHVPLLVRLPGETGGRRVDHVVRLIDLPATILDMAGVGGAVAPGGRSLLPLMRGQGDPSPAARSEGLLFADDKWSLRQGPLKYIRSRHGTEEIYDLDADPGELRNLVGRDDLLASLRSAAEAVDPAPRPTIAAVTPRLDPATRMRMRALGYGD